MSQSVGKVEGFSRILLVAQHQRCLGACPIRRNLGLLIHTMTVSHQIRTSLNQIKDLVMASGILTRGSPHSQSRDVYLETSLLPSEQGCSYRPSGGCVLTHYNFWVLPDMIPTRSVHHRFVIYKRLCKSVNSLLRTKALGNVDILLFFM